MFKNKQIQLFIGALNLFALTSSQVTHALEAPATAKKQETQNMTSLKSIESSWLKIPAVCKAKNFFASPNQTKPDIMS